MKFIAVEFCIRLTSEVSEIRTSDTPPYAAASNSNLRCLSVPDLSPLRIHTVCLMLPQHTNDLLFCKSGSLHLSVLWKAGL
jgi:hypothetical protein